MKNWFNAKVDDNKVATIRIFDQIGENWFGEGTSAKGFADELENLGSVEQINLHINSPGGNVYDGLAIYNTLKRHEANVTVYVDGIAASIASIIAMAGDQIIMPENANMFIHNPWTFAGGDADALRKTADELDTMRASLLGVYMSRANIDEADVIAMMDGETMLTAEECVEWGFATALEEASKMAADMNGLATVELARMQAQLEASQAALKQKNTLLEEQVEELASALLESEAELMDREGEVDILNVRIADLEQFVPAAAMDANEVISAVNEAEMPEWLATHCIAGKFGENQVQESISVYAGIRDACVAAGIENPDVVCREHFSDTTSLISALMTEVLAANDVETTGRRDPQPQAGGNVSYTKAYASRKPVTH